MCARWAPSSAPHLTTRSSTHCRLCRCPSLHTAVRAGWSASAATCGGYGCGYGCSIHRPRPQALGARDGLRPVPCPLSYPLLLPPPLPSDHPATPLHGRVPQAAQDPPPSRRTPAATRAEPQHGCTLHTCQGALRPTRPPFAPVAHLLLRAARPSVEVACKLAHECSLGSCGGRRGCTRSQACTPMVAGASRSFCVGIFDNQRGGTVIGASLIREREVHVQCTYRAHTMHMLCTCRAHTMHMACTCRAYAVHVPCICHTSYVQVVFDLARSTISFIESDCAHISPASSSLEGGYAFDTCSASRNRSTAGEHARAARAYACTYGTHAPTHTHAPLPAHTPRVHARCRRASAQASRPRSADAEAPLACAARRGARRHRMAALPDGR